MENDLFKILVEMAGMYEEALKYMSPTERCNKEANLTSFFHKAIVKIDSCFKEAVSYDELPVPSKFRPGKTGEANKDAIDSVLYRPFANELFLVEAKETMNPWNSIAWDIIRADNVVNSVEVFPKKLKNQEGECLGTLYNATKAFGLILYGHWSYLGLDDAKKEVIEGLESADNPSLGSHPVNDDNVLLKEIRLQDKKQINDGWRYYLVIHFWRIEKPIFEEDLFVSLPSSSGDRDGLTPLYGMIRRFSNVLGRPSPKKTNSENLRMYPPHFVEIRVRRSVKEENLCLWIPLREERIVALCGLSNRAKGISLAMPEGWSKDETHTYDDGTFRDNYVYELGEWDDLFTSEGRDRLCNRIKSFSETVLDIQII